MNSPANLTDLIHRARNGDAGALQLLFKEAYPELRRIARARLRRNERGTLLDTTALVHESYMRFVKSGQLQLDDRVHFLGYAGQIMRSVIVDFARERLSKRRGGDQLALTLTNQLGAPDREAADEILRVHEAVDGLAKHDPRMVKVVELRYFGGLTEAQIAEALGIAERTVRRDWEKARLLLAESLS
jgi:RNA polymerase sigma factor (TIGR02999 family)